MSEHRVPRHLTQPRQRWLRDLLTDHEFNDSEWNLAVLAGETYDRGQTARRQLGREGLTITTRFGEVRAHPCVAIARDCAATYSRLLRQLALDAEAEE